MTELHLASKRDITLLRDSLKTRHYYLSKYSCIETDPANLQDISIEITGMERLLASIEDILINIQKEDNS
jgi:hypothetical protein